MRKSIQLSIKNPCTEDFNTFSKTNKGGFCNSCVKEVFDFTTMSSEEIQKYFSTTKHTTCGRFNKSQLKTYTEPLTVSQQNKFNIFGAISLTAIALFFSNNATSQNDNYLIQTEKSIKENGKSETQNMFSISGVVYSNIDDLPIPGVGIVFKNSIRGTDTDFDGFFTLNNVKIGDVIRMHSIGFSTQEFVITNTDDLKIHLDEDANTLEDIIIVGEVDTKQHYKTKRNLLQRIKSIF